MDICAITNVCNFNLAVCLAIVYFIQKKAIKLSNLNPKRIFC